MHPCFFRPAYFVLRLNHALMKRSRDCKPGSDNHEVVMHSDEAELRLHWEDPFQQLDAKSC